MAKEKEDKKIKTKTPTGLKITRKNNVFTFSWKKQGADAKDGQYVRRRWQTASLKKNSKTKKIEKKSNAWTKWINYTINTYVKKGGKTVIEPVTKLGANVTSRTLKINLKDFYPYSKNGKTCPFLYKIEFGVKTNQDKDVKKKVGKKTTKVDPSESKEATKIFEIKPPLTPTVTATLNSDTINRTTFQWSANHAADNANWATHCYVKERTRVESWNPGAWKAVSNNWSGTIYRTEQEEILANHSIIHELLVTVQGPNGYASKIASHVYGRPRQAVVYTNPSSAQRSRGITPPSVTLTNADGMICTLYWTSTVNQWHPIDYTAVEYAITTPGTNMSCPDDVSWKAGPIVYTTGKLDGTSFSVDGTINDNQVLFVRVNNYHDTDAFTAYGRPVLVSNGLTFYLSDPTGLAIASSDDNTCRVTITAQNEASSVPDSRLAVYFRQVTKDKTGKTVVKDEIIHIFNGGTSDIIQCPNWHNLDGYSFGVRAFVGTVKSSQKSAGFPASAGEELANAKYTVYTIQKTQMISRNILWRGGDIPTAPKQIDLVDKGNGTINVAWDWAWTYANTAELSWADHEDAWESTDEPSTYRIEGTHIPRWNIAGLDPGVKWYIRVRLIKVNVDDGTETAGPWSSLDLGEGHSYIDLASAPNIPLLTIPSYVTTSDEDFTASWDYSSTDGTIQDYAELSLVTVNNDGTLSYSEPIARNDGENGSSQNIVINPFSEELNWQTDVTYNLAVRVRSASGRFSDWSAYQSIRVVKPLTVTLDMEATTLVNRPETTTEEKVVPAGDGTDTTETIEVVTPHYFLTTLPLTVKATGAGEDGTTTVTILRSEPYHMERPDESDFDGFENELVVRKGTVGEAPIGINLVDLKLGASFDDTAKYKLICSVEDEYGQYKELDPPLEFTVDWAHQALMPVGEVEFNDEDYISVITLGTPDPVTYTDPVTQETITDSMIEGDTYDIYRLSVDKPELIVKGAKAGETYVDPYPALGEYGGHRIVYKTIYGDYITRDQNLAWLDVGEASDTMYNIINFDGRQIFLFYNLDLSSSWAKDFKETKYLGGHIQGDWNPAVSRTGSINTVSVTTMDQETIQLMRRLATYPGICHVRTRDGSSYAADIQVSETLNHDPFELVSYSLTITRVDSEQLDGVTLTHWESMQTPTDDIDYEHAEEEEAIVDDDTGDESTTDEPTTGDNTNEGE